MKFAAEIRHKYFLSMTKWDDSIEISCLINPENEAGTDLLCAVFNITILTNYKKFRA